MAEEPSDRAKRLLELRKEQRKEQIRARYFRAILMLSITAIALSSAVFAFMKISDSRLLYVFGKSSANDAFPAFIFAVSALFFATFFVLFAASRNSDEGQRSNIARFSGAMAESLLKVASFSATATAGARAADSAIAATRALAEAKKQESHDFMRRPTDYVDVLTQFRLRMRGEERRLKINSVVNLMWGIFFSLLSGGWLLYSVADLKDHTNYSSAVEMIAAYAPRSALAIILQLVGFFFLRLYAATEHEIKHHKNEITNMESRFAGAMFDSNTSTPATRAIVLKSFMSVERNFLIKKGERTAATDVDTRYNDLAAMLETLVQGIGERPKPKSGVRKPA